jgi:outer membrane receptor protein involved in Fe transport
MNQLIVDRDRSVDTFYFEYQKNTSYSTVSQVELSIMPFHVLTVRLAYKYLDVRAEYGGKMQQQVMTPRHRYLVNLAYESRNKRWSWDATFSLYGKMRLHDMVDETGYNQGEYTTVVPNVLSQVTYRTKKVEWYVGGENLLNFTQKNPIIAADQPFGANFDATRVWAPILGTVVYVGFRTEIKHKEKEDE